MTTFNYGVTNVIIQALIMPVFIIAVAAIIIRMKMFSSSVFEGMKKAEFTYQETTFWNQDFLPWRSVHCARTSL